MTVNGKVIALPSGSNAYAVIDSGTTGVVVPDDVLAAIFAAVPNSEQIQTDPLDYIFRELPTFFFCAQAIPTELTAP